MKFAAGTTDARVGGLDSIRFVCAMFVVFAHLGFLPAPEIAGAREPGLRLLRGLLGNLFPGPPAVVVFFVISGFCIHYPHRRAATMPLGPYFVRRYLRIGMPLVAGILIVEWLVPGHPVFDLAATSDTVIWSLVAELVYYTLYPLLLPCIRRFGWGRLIFAAFALAMAVVILNPYHHYYLSFGPWQAWMVGLPSWLLGCHMAEGVDSTPPCVGGGIWKWRLAVWASASGSSVLMFHAHIGYPWTLPAFSWLCVQWLRRELGRNCDGAMSRAFEWAGGWSYSLYLLHLVVAAVWKSWAPPIPNARLACMVQLGVVLVVCYVFYLTVELPSHWLARRLSRCVKAAPRTAP